MSGFEVQAYAATKAGGQLEKWGYQLPELGGEHLDLKVEYCGICHSDLSMLDNEWGMTEYPFVPGHEIVGRVLRAGDNVKGVEVGQRVGLGWSAGSCMHCSQCMDGAHHRCGTMEQTIVGRHGGFADIVRCHWSWAIPIAEGVDPAKAGPLFCGGITVFNPIATAGIKPTDRVGVIGIGGLGHLALQFLNKWGCEVTAFTSSASKAEEARQMGAHNIVNSRDDAEMAKLEGSLNFIINTTNVALNWDAYLAALGPGGTLHTVGAVLEPMAVPAFTLISGDKKVSGSPLGSPALNKTMLEFCGRHGIAPVTEEFAMEDVNSAIEHLRAGKARYRVVLKA